jgi:aspartate kinase
MKVFKFGGASLRNAAAIRNTAAIVKSNADVPLVVVVSAMGKTTNALESILNTFVKGGDYQTDLDLLKNYHFQVCDELFATDHKIAPQLNSLFDELSKKVKHPGDDDLVYDQVVSMGEVISSFIVEKYLSSIGLNATWLDSRKYILTDSTFREGKVQWKETFDNMAALRPILQKNMVVTQGFIGATREGLTSTLGREGSDFTAAIYASCLQAESVTIWKDVPGVMSADPKRLPNSVVFPELPYKEAAEMTYYGASVIHPKTIQPLALKEIPLLVKSFENPSLPGTKIHECHVDQLPPLIVFKENQCLISCKVTGLHFCE